MTRLQTFAFVALLGILSTRGVSSRQYYDYPAGGDYSDNYPSEDSNDNQNEYPSEYSNDNQNEYPSEYSNDNQNEYPSEYSNNYPDSYPVYEENSESEMEARPRVIRPNSFVYSTTIDLASDNDYFSSLIVSKSAGPLCSGAHLSPLLVVTAASCVYRETSSDIFVVSNRDPDFSDSTDKYYLQVRNYTIHPQYNSKTNNHNVAVLLLKDYDANPPVLTLPKSEKFYPAYAPVYHYIWNTNTSSYSYYPKKEVVKYSKKLNHCKAKTGAPLLCVSTVNSWSFARTPMDIGTPLILRHGRSSIFYGLFTDYSFYELKKYYIYQDGVSNLPFLYEHLDSVSGSKKNQTQSH